MTDITPECPMCGSPYTYVNNMLFICSQCAHEWSHLEQDHTVSHELDVVKDAHGTMLHDGDTISIIKDLKIKGSSQSVKVGTKVKNIRVLPGEDHNIDCRIEGIGAMKLKSEFVRKV